LTHKDAAVHQIRKPDILLLFFLSRNRVERVLKTPSGVSSLSKLARIGEQLLIPVRCASHKLGSKGRRGPSAFQLPS
jgi:hypothetical protein